MIESLAQLFQTTEDGVDPERTLVAEAYHRLRADIVSGKLKPGEKLRIEHLKEGYNVSSATLREALSLLTADALVISQHQRGFRVAPMSLEDFKDITETRATLEGRAIRLAIRNADHDWEAELSAAYHRLSRAEDRLGGDDEVNAHWEECNRRFHAALNEGSGSRWLRHFLSILYRQSERYRRLALRNAPDDRDVHQEHQDIYEAVMDRNEDEAARLIERHVRATLDVVEAFGAPDGTDNAAI